jgi:hypothetical protein
MRAHTVRCHFNTVLHSKLFTAVKQNGSYANRLQFVYGFPLFSENILTFIVYILMCIIPGSSKLLAKLPGKLHLEEPIGKTSEFFQQLRENLDIRE